MIFNFIFWGIIWKYFSEFFKEHVKGGLNYKTMCALKNSEKYFQILQKNEIENHYFKKLKIFIEGGICPGHFRRSHSFKVVLDP